MYILENIGVKTHSGGIVKISITVPDHSITVLVDEVGLCIDDLVDLVKRINNDIAVLYHEIYSTDLSINDLSRITGVKHRYNHIVSALLESLVNSSTRNIFIEDPFIYTPRNMWSSIASLINDLKTHGKAVLIYSFFGEYYRGLISIDKIYRVTSSGVEKGSSSEYFTINGINVLVYGASCKSLLNIEGVKGCIMLNNNVALLVIDKRYYMVFKRHITELYYKGVVKGFKFLARGLIKIE